jgi:phosphate uptake regulator
MDSSVRIELFRAGIDRSTRLPSLKSTGKPAAAFKAGSLPSFERRRNEGLSLSAHKQIQLVRRHLLDMSKMAHRAVDYAIKGYKLGSPEFCRFVRRGDRQLNDLRRRITQLCQKLLLEEFVLNPEAMIEEVVLDCHVRFAISALRITGALHAICTAAFEIAHHTMLLLEEFRTPACAALERTCHLVNRLMCLCIIALFKKESGHAEAVLQNPDEQRLFDQAVHELRSSNHRPIAIPTALELAIANSLRQIAKETREISEAVLFWLEGERFALESRSTASR